MDLLDCFVHREEQGKSQPLQDEEEEQDRHRYLKPQREEKKEKIELEDELALPDDLMFS